ncbi:MAG: dTDP-4-dehydrorhamnose 3,5-epimerase [Bacteroidetes bacterium]|nr:dTDP-4-dehydrorhamnose 3,5-epimerase [Bacteroidota bacterium]
MKFIETPLEGLILIEPKIFRDDRGYFFESFNSALFSEYGITAEFVQDNQSMSHRGVLRGLHFQNPPHEQGKLIRVSRGAVLDVTVDIRKNSSTFGQYYSVELSESNLKMLWIPPGFAHGFLTLEDHTLFLYKCTGLYNKSAESGIRYDDPDLGIQWKEKNPVLSGKDLDLPSWKEYIRLPS